MAPANGNKSIDNVDADSSPPVWPHQAHHLVPWKQLKDEDVVIYLDAGEDEIFGDNNYSVNHGNNGLFMPYSADLSEWLTTASKQQLSEDLMDKVNIQLHQSRHSSTQYNGAKQGYKARVKSYLKTISDNGLVHADTCDPCKAAKKNDKLPPRSNIVSAMDRASSNLENDIADMDIFVSRRASIWAGKTR